MAGERRRSRDRVGAAIVVLCTVGGVWLGVTAPATSPVTPSTPMSYVVPTSADG